MYIADDTIAQVREANDIVEVISEYVPNLKRAGKDFKGLCPFHQEKTPSFLISPAKGIFHCFGCGTGGDAFKFVMEMERCTYPEAIKKLAERKNIPIQESAQDKSFSLAQDRKKFLLSVLQRAAQFYHKNLTESEDAKSAKKYLQEKRGLTQETISKFQLGWAPEFGQPLLRAALKAGLKENDLADAGLIVRSQKDGRWRDWFRKRIVFPIFDLKGQVIAFGGRILDESPVKNDYTPPKYLNSPETSLFHKGKNLYGFYQGLKSIRSGRHVLVLEGYMDVIGCHQAGVDYAVAPLGTSFTTDQCQILKRYAEQVTLLFDSDAAGESAALRSSEILLEFGFIPMIACLPNGVDADEYLQKHSITEFTNLLHQSMSVVEFKLKNVESKSGDAPDVVKKSIAIETILPLILKIENEVVKSDMLRIVAERLGVSQEAVRTEILKLRKSQNERQQKSEAFKQNVLQKGEKPGSQSKPAPRSLFLSLEEELLCLVVQHPDLLSRLETIPGKDVVFQDQRAQECYGLLKQNHTFQIGDLLNQVSEETSKWLSSLLARQVKYTKSIEDIFGSLIQRLESKQKQEQLELFRQQAIKSLDQGTISEAVTQFQRLTPAVKGTQRS